VTQKGHSMVILQDLATFFTCGNVVIDNKSFDAYKFQVSKLDDIVKYVFPHFDNYALVGSKRLDYLT
jgi:hypothetical protein